MSAIPSWTAKNLALLVGHTITGAFVDNDDEFCGFNTKDPDGQEYRVWVDRDDEGNGCGSVAVHKVGPDGKGSSRIYPERG